MHPLRFPNSGIRAKVLRVLVTFSQRRQQGGGPATHDQVSAKAPYKGAVGCSQGQPEREASGARKGRRLWAEASPVGRSVARVHNRLQRSARKGCRLHGARKGLPPVGAATPAAGVATPWQGS
ncbi:hypothetical protein GW17_00049240 [Ensete ventricosum]|nr:hypothetical protein GW17_00049240 [Ensete ventricosum]